MIRRILRWSNPVRWWETVRANPVVLKEMRSRMRGWRAATAVTGFLVLIAGTVGMIYFGFTQSGSAITGVTIRKTIGQSIFYTIFMLQLFIVGVSAPALTASAIAAEREHQTYDLLRTTLLSARALVIGKLIASVSFVLLLLIVTIPVQSIGFLFGGVTLGEVILGTLVLVQTALAFGAIGLFFSSMIRRARIAAVLTQITTTMLSIGFPAIGLIGLSFVSAFGFATFSSFPEWIALALGWLVVITSPLATAIATEVVLIEEQTFFFFQGNLSGLSIWIPSPWMGFAVLYAAVTVIFIVLAARIVRRPERQ